MPASQRNKCAILTNLAQRGGLDGDLGSRQAPCGCAVFCAIAAGTFAPVVLKAPWPQPAVSLRPDLGRKRAGGSMGKPSGLEFMFRGMQPR